MFYMIDENHNITPCSLEEWSNQFETMERHVALDKIGNIEISTVWLGNDHNYVGGKPLLFETMIFEGKGNDIYMDRYSTWDEAEKGHQKAVQWVKNGCKEE